MKLEPGKPMPDLMQKASEVFIDICILGILWLLCSLPIVTIGAANTAVYAVFMAHIAQGEKDRVRPFFTAFRQHFKKSTHIWLMIVPVMALFAVDSLYYLFGAGSGLFYLSMGIIQLCLLAVVIMISCYAFPLLVLYNKSVKDTLLSSIKHACIRWPWSLLAVAVSVAIPAVVAVGLWHFAFLFAGVIGYANSHIMVKALRNGVATG